MMQNPSFEAVAVNAESRDAETASVELVSIRAPQKSNSNATIIQHQPLNYQDEFHNNRKIAPKEKRKWYSPFPYRTTTILLTLPLALSPIVILAGAAELASQSYIMGRECYPNGSWKEASGATWRIMDSSYFFTPNLSFGAFSFTQVKVVDIAWDLLIGRGGQMLLAWVNYRVFNEWLVWHMEVHRTSYKMYAAVAFETTSMGTLGVLGKEVLAVRNQTRSIGDEKKGGKWKWMIRWVAVLGMLLSTLYVLSFPTLMAAMTGYITTYKPYVENTEGSLIELKHFGLVSYVINDAERIGHQSPLTIMLSDEYTHVVELYLAYFNGTAGFKPYPPNTYNRPGYAELSGINTNSVWQGMTEPIYLRAPSLNITAFRTDTGGSLLSKTQQANASRGNSSTSALAYVWRGNTTFTPQYVREHGSCKPTETYQWGFSYIFLFMVAIFNFIWSCIMVGMWLDTRRGSRMYRNGRRPGLLRSIMDFSAAIREEIGLRAEVLEEEELRRRVTESGGALIVPKTELAVRRTSAEEELPRRRDWKRNLTRGSTF